MLRRLCCVLAFTLTGPALVAQSRSDQLIATAREHMTAREWDAAAAALNDALQVAPYVMDSVNVFVWRGILEYLRGSDSLARVNFRLALKMHGNTGIKGLDQVAPGLQALWDSELRAASTYDPSNIDQPAAWRAGPALVYPAEMRRRHIAGHVTVRAVVDTLGKIEPEGIQVLETPDTAFVPALRQMLLAAQFTPGQLKGQPVRSVINLGFNLTPPPPQNPVALTSEARDELRAHHADSALALTREALDSANSPSEASRAYALLVEGIAWHAKGRDSLAARDFDAGESSYRDLTSRGVDLAPFLKRLADSIRFSRRRAGAAQPFAALSVVGQVDQPPVLLSHPPIRYAPEMQALGVGGTVVVEALLDTNGRVVPASVRVVQSPNPIFDAETKRVVSAARYRAARLHGRAVQVTIRQPVTFAPY